MEAWRWSAGLFLEAVEMTTGSEPFSEMALESFRKHRHDVLNFLQLIRAYEQMGKSQKSIQLVDDLAKWLQSLTLWQIHFEKQHAQLIWQAANCPKVILTEVTSEIQLSIEMADHLGQALLWLNDYMTMEQGYTGYLSIHQDEKKAYLTIRMLLHQEVNSRPLDFIKQLNSKFGCFGLEFNGIFEERD